VQGIGVHAGRALGGPFGAPGDLGLDLLIALLTPHHAGHGEGDRRADRGVAGPGGVLGPQPPLRPGRPGPWLEETLERHRHLPEHGGGNPAAAGHGKDDHQRGGGHGGSDGKSEQARDHLDWPRAGDLGLLGASAPGADQFSPWPEIHRMATGAGQYRPRRIGWGRAR
jgi:hypothetical protein